MGFDCVTVCGFGALISLDRLIEVIYPDEGDFNIDKFLEYVEKTGDNKVALRYCCGMESVFVCAPGYQAVEGGTPIHINVSEMIKGEAELEQFLQVNFPEATATLMTFSYDY